MGVVGGWLVRLGWWVVVCVCVYVCVGGTKTYLSFRRSVGIADAGRGTEGGGVFVMQS